jgi:chorismate mutase/prephenate dehydrogenase
MAPDPAPRPDLEQAPPEDREAAEARLSDLRSRIVELDDELIRLVGRRRDLVLEVGEVKVLLDLPVLDPPQEARVVRRAAERARELGVDQELVRDVIWRIIAAARQAQEKRTSWGPPELPPS